MASALACSCDDEAALVKAREVLALFEDAACEAGCVVASAVFDGEHEMLVASTEVIVKNDDGSTTVMLVPKSAKQVKASPQREAWVSSDQTAFDALLHDPNNTLVPETKPAELGVPVAPCVTVRTLKLDKATGKLNATSYKSRHAFDAARWGPMMDARGLPHFEKTSSTVADDLLFKMNCSDAAARDRDITKLDVGNAYTKGERKRAATYMHTPATLPIFNAAGVRMVIEFNGTPVWGEPPAGAEWQATLQRGLIEDGWLQAEGVPCMFTRSTGADVAVAIVIVDDIFVSEAKGSHAVAKLMHTQLERRYGKGEVKIQHEPDSFAGYTILRDRSRRALTLTMASVIEAAAREHVPAYVAGATRAEMGLPTGKRMQVLSDGMRLPPPAERAPKLSAQQRTVRTMLGKLRWYEKVTPALTHQVHNLSCVATYPTPEAEVVARVAMCDAYDRRLDGITFGGGGLCSAARLTGDISAAFDMADGAPSELEVTADSTWDGANVYAILLTMYGGAVAHGAKLMHLIVDSSTESEAIATAKAGELVAYAREVLRAMGLPPQGPTFVGSDNKANALIASGRALPSRLRHCLRRYLSFLQRVDAGECEIGHVRDAENPSDFMTKFVPTAKFETSNEYATNAKNAVRA